MKQRTATPDSNSAASGDQQAPLGTDPSYDELLDVAVEYTFPCSDPVAVSVRERPRRQGGEKGPMPPPGQGSQGGQPPL